MFAMFAETPAGDEIPPDLDDTAGRRDSVRTVVGRLNGEDNIETAVSRLAETPASSAGRADGRQVAAPSAARSHVADTTSDDAAPRADTSDERRRADSGRSAGSDDKADVSRELHADALSSNAKRPGEQNGDSAQIGARGEGAQSNVTRGGSAAIDTDRDDGVLDVGNAGSGVPRGVPSPSDSGIGCDVNAKRSTEKEDVDDDFIEDRSNSRELASTETPAGRIKSREPSNGGRISERRRKSGENGAITDNSRVGAQSMHRDDKPPRTTLLPRQDSATTHHTPRDNATVSSELRPHAEAEVHAPRTNGRNGDGDETRPVVDKTPNKNATNGVLKPKARDKPPAGRTTNRGAKQRVDEPQDAQLTDRQPIAARRASRDQTTDQRPIADRRASRDQPIADRLASRDQPIADRRASRDQPIADRRASRDQPIADRRASRDQPIADRRASRDQRPIANRRPSKDPQTIDRQPVAGRRPKRDQQTEDERPKADARPKAGARPKADARAKADGQQPSKDPHTAAHRRPSRERTRSESTDDRPDVDSIDLQSSDDEDIFEKARRKYGITFDSDD